MRSPRIVIAILALALTTSMSFTASSASARVDARTAPVAAKASTSERAAVKVTAKVVKIRLAPNRPARLVIKGKVTPAQGPVYIQRATKCNKAQGTCNFKFFRKVFLKKGRYQTVIGAPGTRRSWLWRAKVKSSYSDIWQTCTKRPTQSCTVPY